MTKLGGLVEQERKKEFGQIVTFQNVYSAVEANKAYLPLLSK